jgi:hypothetical protein
LKTKEKIPYYFLGEVGEIRVKLVCFQVSIIPINLQGNWRCIEGICRATSVMSSILVEIGILKEAFMSPLMGCSQYQW